MQAAAPPAGDEVLAELMAERHVTSAGQNFLALLDARDEGTAD